MISLIVAAGLLALCCGRLQAADQAFPLAGPVDHADPRAKIASVIRSFIDAPVGPQGIDARLRAMTVPASRPDLLRIRLDLRVTDATLAIISATGAGIISSSVRWNSVVVDATMAQIDALAHVPEVRLLAPAYRPRHQSTQPGTYVDEADTVIATAQVRSVYGVTGAGQTIGVISDSINVTRVVGAGTVTGSNPGVLTATKAQNSGNLPASITVCNITDNGGSTDEGEAMMEEAYHLASGAAFAFSPCGQSDSDMAGNIGLLGSQAHCSIICDDVVFLDEPMFQDGPIAQAANEFVAGGGIYLTAAGNNANYGVLATYTPVSATPDPHTGGNPDGNSFHNWGVSGSSTPGFLPIVIPYGDSIDIILEWNQPYQSYGLGPGSSSDFNLYLYDATNTQVASVVTSSTTVQGTALSPAGDPYEIVSYTNSSASKSSVTLYVAVDYAGGASANQVMRLLFFTDGWVVTSPGNSLLSFGTSMGHQTASNVLTIAAMDYSTTPYAVETFSSLGGWNATGIPYYFDTTGALLSNAPQLRNKPDVTAPDGITIWNSNFKPAFYGTSAATPHAAAAAALSWCAQPTLTNAQIISQMEASATDINVAPATVGPDPWSGYGLVNALASVGKTYTSISSITTSAANGTYTSGTIPITLTFTNPVTVSGSPMLLLNTSPPVSATYASGSGTAALIFNYLIQAGETDARLDVASATALSGGTMTSSAPFLSLTLPAPGALGSLSSTVSTSHIKIDSRTAQTITFTPIATMYYGETVTIAASSTSLLTPAVTWVSGPATLSGLQLTATGLGTVVIAANQAGNGTYLPAPQATLSIVVGAAPDSVGVPQTTTVVYDASPQPVVATVAGPSAPVAAVTYQPWSGNPAQGGASTAAATSVAPTVVGWYLVTATLDANHGGGVATGGLSITPAPVTVTAVSQSITYGTAPATPQWTMSALQGADHTSVITGAPVLATTATSTSPVGSYPITVDVSHLSAQNYSFTGVNGTVTVSPSTASISLPGAPIVAVYSAAPHMVTPVLGGSPTPTATVTYQPWSGNPTQSGSTTTGAATATAPTAAGWYQVVATLGSNFGGASTSVALHITPAVLTVTAASQTIIFGTAPAALSSSMATFLGTDTSTVVSGAPVLTTTATSSSTPGSYPILVGVSGLSAANYTFVGANGTVTVSQAAQTITFPNPGAVVNAQGQIPLSATSTSGLGVAFSIVSGPATLSGPLLTITGPGTVVVEADQAGNADFMPGAPVRQSIVVTQLAQTITFSPVGNQALGVAPVLLVASASSGLAPAFSVISGPATIVGTTLTITAAGTVVIAADQPGDATYLPAPEVTQSITVAATAGSEAAASPAAGSSTGGGGSHCGFGSGFGALVMVLAVLACALLVRVRQR